DCCIIHVTKSSHYFTYLRLQWSLSDTKRLSLPQLSFPQSVLSSCRCKTAYRTVSRPASSPTHATSTCSPAAVITGWWPELRPSETTRGSIGWPRVILCNRIRD